MPHVLCLDIRFYTMLLFLQLKCLPLRFEVPTSPGVSPYLCMCSTVVDGNEPMQAEKEDQYTVTDAERKLYH